MDLRVTVFETCTNQRWSRQRQGADWVYHYYYFHWGNPNLSPP